MIMKFIITESQYQKLFESHANFKPAREFDKIYGTKLGQSYNFGHDLTSDDVWDIIQDCYEKEDCDAFRKLIIDLDETMFPYPGIKNMKFKTKIDVLQGMASEFNFDDIVHFAIKEKTGLKDKSFNKFWDSLKDSQREQLQWIASPKTLKIIKKLLKK